MEFLIETVFNDETGEVEFTVETEVGRSTSSSLDDCLQMRGFSYDERKDICRKVVRKFVAQQLVIKF